MLDGHGDDSYKYRKPIQSNFSSNIYNKVDLTDLQTHLYRFIQGKAGEQTPISSYPEPEPYKLETILAQKLKVKPEEVCATNGATEAIYLIAQTFKNSHTCILQPTFSEYADACRLHGHHIQALYQLPTEQDGFVLPKEVRMLWLCNPNNPTGWVTDKSYLHQLVTHNPQVCFVIDQSYEHFTLHALFSADEAVAYHNVFLLHSMTKQYAIPGLRLGYITGHPTLLAHIRHNRMPWSVNAIAIEAGIYLTQNESSFRIDLAAYLAETRRLHTNLEKLGGLEVWETHAHFMLTRLHFGKAPALKEYLAEEHGILIRDASNFNGLDESFFRIATQTPEENDRLTNAIAYWFAC